jgi:PKD repeat protein
MKKFSLQLFFLLVVAGFGNVYSQAPDWSRLLQVNTIGVSSADVLTADANFIYMAGSITGPLTFGGSNLTSAGTRDLIVSKFTKAGVVVWTKQFNAGDKGIAYPRFIKTDPAGNIYISGFYNGSLKIGSSTITSDPAGGTFIAKINSAGTGLWTTAFFSDLGVTRNRIATDASGNVYLISNGSKLLKFNSSGTLLWEQGYPANTLLSVLVSGVNLILAGELQFGTTMFGTIPVQSINGNTVAFLAKADLNGTFINVVTEGAPSLSSKDGVYHATGTFNHPVNGPRVIDLDRQVIGNEENILSTTVADLGTYTLILTINGDNTVSIAGEISPTQPLYASGANFYDPLSESFTLNYSYDAVTGTRSVTEVLQKIGPVAGGNSVISDLALDNTGKIIVTGGFTKDLKITNMYGQNQGFGGYAFAGRCNSNFDFDWITYSTHTGYSTTSYFNQYRVFADNSSNIFMYGPYNNSTMTFGTLTVPGAGGEFLVKLDSTGLDINANRTESNVQTQIFVTSEGKVITSGANTSVETLPFGMLFVNEQDENVNLEWNAISTNNKAGRIKINYVKHDNLGNIYVQSRVTGYCNYFGNIINNNSALTVISKHDIKGDMLWMRVIPDISVDLFGQAFTLDKDNNILTVGLFQSVLNIGSTALTSINSGREGYVAKYTPNGDFLWASKFDLARDININVTLTSDSSGNVIVTGMLNPENFLIKYDPDGNLLWSKVMPMASYYLSLVSCDKNDNIYLTSEIHLSDETGSTTIDAVTLNQTYDDGSIGVFKFNSDGQAIWAKTFGGLAGATYSDGWPNDIKTDPAGFTYIWGWCVNNATFGSYTLTNPVDNGFSYYVFKMDPSGNVIWANGLYETKYNNLYGFNYGALMDFDKAGNIYLGGHFRNTMSIDGTLFQPEKNNDFFVTKLSNAGAFQWIKTIPSNSNSMICQSLSVYSEDILSIATYPGFYSSIGNFAINAVGGTNGLIATLGKLGTCNAQFKYSWDGFASFTDLSDGSPTAWVWDFGDGTNSTLQNPNHNYTKSGKYTVKLTIYNENTKCLSSVTKEVTAGVDIPCTADFESAINSANGTGTFTSKSTGATDYYWEFGDGSYSIDANPVHTYIKAGLYKVCLTIWNGTSGCQAVSCKDVLYIPAEQKYITADFSFYPSTTDNTVSFSDLSSSNATDWYWTMGDGKVMKTQNPVYTYSKPGVYEVCLIAIDRVNSLSHSVCKEVKVGEITCNLKSGFSYFVNPETLEVSFSDQSTGLVSDYFWTFGDGTTSTKQNPVHSYSAPGFYMIRMAVKNNSGTCTDLASEFIQVGSLDCRSLFIYNIDPLDNTVYFADDSKGNIEFYYWEFGDGTVSVLENPEKKYSKPGIYVVGETVIDNTNGCIDFSFQAVQAGDIDCSADFISYIDSASFTGYFTNRIMGESTALLWSFGDGRFSTSDNPVHIFPGPGIYSVGLNTYDLNSGCMDFYQEMLTVGGIGNDCEADFIYMVNPNDPEVIFSNRSIGDIVGAVWNFGDGTDNSTEVDPVHTFSKGGYYNVCLSVINSEGTRNMGCKWILVSGTEVNDIRANFMFNIDSANLKVKFVDNSFGDIDKYTWDFGDSRSDSVSNERDPEHTYDSKGYYLVRLKVENTASDFASNEFKLVNVAESQVLKASFGYEAREPEKKVSGYPVDLVAASSGDGATVEWDFGDKQLKKDGGFTVMDSTSRVVTHYYQKPGKYTVCVRISDPANGQTDTYCQTVYTKFAVGTNLITDTQIALMVYPNPFTERTAITFALPERQFVDLSVYDQLGRKIETLVNGWYNSDLYKVDLSSHSLAPGVYFLKLVSEDQIITRQIVVSK